MDDKWKILNVYVTLSADASLAVSSRIYLVSYLVSKDDDDNWFKVISNSKTLVTDLSQKFIFFSLFLEPLTEKMLNFCDSSWCITALK